MTRDALTTAMLESLRTNRSVLVLIVAYIVSAVVVGRVFGFEVPMTLYSRLWLVICFASFWAVLVPIVLVQLYRHRPVSPIRFAWTFIVRDLRIVERALAALPLVAIFPLLTSAFTSVKSAIGLMHPYRFDPLFARVDSLLHGGHAWELIHPIFGFPLATFVLNFSYNLWFFMVWITFALVTVMIGNRELREQYLLAFCGCWIVLGSLAAAGLSSVGPGFYGLLYPGAPDPYAGLMSYLHAVEKVYPVWALAAQDMLWQAHLSNNAGPGSGISAMPSLHVALAALNALLLSRLSRTAGILGWAYLVLVLAGSVHLGWHYAIDGYVSLVGVLVIWGVAGWWASPGTASAPVVPATICQRLAAHAPQGLPRT